MGFSVNLKLDVERIDELTDSPNSDIFGKIALVVITGGCGEDFSVTIFHFSTVATTRIDNISDRKVHSTFTDSFIEIHNKRA